MRNFCLSITFSEENSSKGKKIDGKKRRHIFKFNDSNIYTLINTLITVTRVQIILVIFLNFLGTKRQKLQHFRLPFFDATIHFSVDSGEKVQRMFFCGIYKVTLHVALA